jgi:glutamine synthetase
LLDNTDRNRTSPFAFTGNKFEFRAVGSSANCAGAMIVLNSIVADQLIKFKKETDALIDKGINKDEAILQVLRSYIVSSKNILFEGNGYGEEWVKEAAKRGLTNIKSAPRAYDAFVSEKSIKVFENLGIFNKVEQEARHEIYLEMYTKKIQIEARVMGDLALNHIIPTAIRYQNILITNVKGLKEVLSASEFKKHSEVTLNMIKDISEHVTIIKNNVEAMIEERKKANKKEDGRDKAIAYGEKVKAYFDVIRYHADKLELMIDDEMWPLPKYREMLLTR